ncbi:uncharacterized protein GGS22DRAFT_171307 [Annulohypoxylon maeteangense]|uniref:uncharacterized protein n=1 Tax=Annulohypoxylon maeteangense TaxID=1927788 RepID=UPI0020075B43|nr:uncharacterized protein GGS22DRAFT_171307 [Annulohypoxylon maeteangense]KAI0881997.1 hypothetical protein GGS22DRAFT_171307 [Annulohypoxylon maeteangense]
MNRDTTHLLDTHNRKIATIVGRFSNIVAAATASIYENPNTIEQASSNSLKMQTEASALVSEIQGLLSLNRQLKLLWMSGPLRQPGEEDAREAVIDAQANSVVQLYDQALVMRDAAIAKIMKDKAEGGAHSNVDS